MTPQEAPQGQPDMGAANLEGLIPNEGTPGTYFHDDSVGTDSDIRLRSAKGAKDIVDFQDRVQSIQNAGQRLTDQDRERLQEAAKEIVDVNDDPYNMYHDA